MIDYPAAEVHSPKSSLRSVCGANESSVLIASNRYPIGTIGRLPGKRGVRSYPGLHAGLMGRLVW